MFSLFKDFFLLIMLLAGCQSGKSAPEQNPNNNTPSQQTIIPTSNHNSKIPTSNHNSNTAIPKDQQEKFFQFVDTIPPIGPHSNFRAIDDITKAIQQKIENNEDYTKGAKRPYIIAKSNGRGKLIDPQNAIFMVSTNPAKGTSVILYKGVQEINDAMRKEQGDNSLDVEKVDTYACPTEIAVIRQVGKIWVLCIAQKSFEAIIAD